MQTAYWRFAYFAKQFKLKMDLSSGKAIQKHLITQVGKQLTADQKLVDELALLLEVSKHGAYRRIRLEQQLTINEVALICSKFDLSFDEYLDASKYRVTFQFKTLNEKDFTFVDYLEFIATRTEKIANSRNKEIFYMAKDFPLFQLINSIELISFKLFFWQKSILNFDSLKNEKFTLGITQSRVERVARKLRIHYLKTPSTELISDEAVDITLRQINMYYDAGLFADDSTALILCDKFHDLVKHMHNQCAQKAKFSPHDLERNKEALFHTYSVYYSNALYSDTAILSKADDECWSFSDNNGIHMMATRDPYYFQQQLITLTSIKNRSLLLSGENAQNRDMVFNKFYKKIEVTKEKIKEGYFNAHK